MELGMISFTARGTGLLYLLSQRLRGKAACIGRAPGRFVTPEMAAAGISPSGDGGAGRFAEEMFAAGRPMLFVGAAGIAVRAIAPWVKDKMTDPAVLVMDEAGQFVIPILSGHVGGANELARLIAGACGAQPVITTATDVNRVFAVDVFAAGNGLAIADRAAARHVAMDLLEGRAVGFFNPYEVELDGQVIRRWTPQGCLSRACQRNICIGVEARPAVPGETLRLVPRSVVVGIGCRRGTTFRALCEHLERTLARAGIMREAVTCVASIDVKRDEQAIVELARANGWEFITYSAEELERVPGKFSESAFVRETVGVGSVCERAAVAAACGGRLILGKQAENGVTAALALRPVRLRAEWGS